MYRKDWSIKPNGVALNELLRVWKTKTSGTTDSTGHFSTRASYGDYDLVVQVPGHLASRVKVRFTKGSSSEIVARVEG